MTTEVEVQINERTKSTEMKLLDKVGEAAKVETAVAVKDPERAARMTRKQSLREFRDQVGEAKTPGGVVDALFACCVGVVGYASLLALLFVTNIVPISMFVVGAIEINNCIEQPMIPIYMIVAGVTCIVISIIGLVARQLKKKNSSSVPAKVLTWTNVVLQVALLAWTIAGAVWTYPAYGNVRQFNTCHKGLYYFAFVTITLSLILGVVISCCTCCVVIVRLFVHE